MASAIPATSTAWRGSVLAPVRRAASAVFAVVLVGAALWEMEHDLRATSKPVATP